MNRPQKIVHRKLLWTLVLLALAVPAISQDNGPADPESQPRAWSEVDLQHPDLRTKGLQSNANGVELDMAGDELRTGHLEGLLEAAFPFNAVHVLWRDQRPVGSDIEMEVAASPDGQNWTRWLSVHEDPHSVDGIRKNYPDGRPNPNFGYTVGGMVSWGLERYTFLRYRVTLAAEGNAVPALHALRFFYQDSTMNGRRGSIGPKAGGYNQPVICDRACWAARTPQCSISQMSAVTRGVIHHTATQTDWNTTSQANSEALVRAHQNFHMDGRGWCDLGYNFLVDKLGNRFEGREGSINSKPRPAQDGINSNSIGVSLMGYLHSPHNQSPPAAMRDAAYDIIAWKVEDPFDGYGSGPYGSYSSIGFLAGHRDVSATACPGDLMYSYIGTNFSAGEARDSVNARITGPAIPCCPDAPVLSSVTSDGNGDSITLSWNDVGLVANYNVYTSNDGVTFGSPISLATGTTSYTETGIAAGQARYYKVSAVGSTTESDTSDVYGAVSGTSSAVLIIDGNDRWVFQTSENPNGENHDFAVRFGAALAGTTFDTADNDTVESGALSLSGYDAVLWMLGEESTAQVTFSATEQSVVSSYLDAGGSLFVSGAEIGWDLVEKGGTADQAFYQNYLKAAYVADDAATYNVNVESGGIFAGLSAISFSGGVMNVAYPDEINVTGGSQGDLRYSTGDLAGISYSGSFRVVHFGFPFETINSASDRSAVMGRVIDFLIPVTPSCTVSEDFEAGATGWYIAASSTCTTGDYVVGNPTQITNSGVVTQVGGSNSGTGSVFTASNTSAGVNDVDGGNCILGSPVWSVANASTLSVAWWHGQRDNGDDPSGDFFRLEYSLNGGSSWTTLRSKGDTTSNATWDVATASIPAGSSVTLRVQCSDGASTGDLVECGIDDVLICSP